MVRTQHYKYNVKKRTAGRSDRPTNKSLNSAMTTAGLYNPYKKKQERKFNMYTVNAP